MPAFPCVGGARGSVLFMDTTAPNAPSLWQLAGRQMLHDFRAIELRLMGVAVMLARKAQYPGATRSNQGAARSNCPARRNNVASSPKRPTNCMPIGSPAAFQCSGTDIAG